MTDKREVELPPLDMFNAEYEHRAYRARALADANNTERKGLLNVIEAGGIALYCREHQLLTALTKISQLEQQILEIQGNAAIRFAEAEARWHRAEDELKVAMRALELAVESDNNYGRDAGAVHFSTPEEFIQIARQESAAEGRIGK